MAKNWCGFMPQNELILLQWAALDIADAQTALKLIADAKAAGMEANAEDETDFSDPDPDSN